MRFSLFTIHIAFLGSAFLLNSVVAHPVPVISVRSNVYDFSVDEPPQTLDSIYIFYTREARVDGNELFGREGPLSQSWVVILTLHGQSLTEDNHVRDNNVDLDVARRSPPPPPPRVSDSSSTSQYALRSSFAI